MRFAEMGDETGLWLSQGTHINYNPNKPTNFLFVSCFILRLISTSKIPDENYSKGLEMTILVNLVHVHS